MPSHHGPRPTTPATTRRTHRPRPNFSGAASSVEPCCHVALPRVDRWLLNKHLITLRLHAAWQQLDVIGDSAGSGVWSQFHACLLLCMEGAANHSSRTLKPPTLIAISELHRTQLQTGSAITFFFFPFVLLAEMVVYYFEVGRRP